VYCTFELFFSLHYASDAIKTATPATSSGVRAAKIQIQYWQHEQPAGPEASHMTWTTLRINAGEQLFGLAIECRHVEAPQSSLKGLRFVANVRTLGEKQSNNN
jgi:hypothetical protein